MSKSIVERIEGGDFGKKQLENVYSNAERLGQLEVAESAKAALKQLDARSYSKRFVKPIRDKVQKIASDIASEQGWGNWADNQVGSGIKPGGPMLKGDELAEFYLSYRHPSWKRSAYPVVFQQDESSPVRYKVKAPDEAEMIVETSEEAIERFALAISGVQRK